MLGCMFAHVGWDGFHSTSGDLCREQDPVDGLFGHSDRSHPDVDQLGRQTSRYAIRSRALVLFVLSRNCG